MQLTDCIYGAILTVLIRLIQIIHFHCAFHLSRKGQTNDSTQLSGRETHFRAGAGRVPQPDHLRCAPRKRKQELIAKTRDILRELRLTGAEEEELHALIREEYEHD